MPVSDNFNPETSPEFDDQTAQQNPSADAADASAAPPADDARGLSQAELNDPNCIRVTIADTRAPLVVLFGPRACGKTMTLVRMARFLKAEGYTVEPIRTFRPKFDGNYAKICENFNATINTDDAAKSTDRISFMLVEVIRNGRRICQILEAPGEYYFNEKKPQNPFPSYVNSIISSYNRKIWAIMLEPDWMDHSDRMNYVARINRLTQSMRPKDSTIFVYNKIDKTNFVRSVGQINQSAAIDEVRNQYPGIFTSFVNRNPITKFFKEYNCDFVPFQTGFYTTTDANNITYQEGPREYCVKLWKCILNKISG